MRGHDVRLVTILQPEAFGFAEELGENHICLGLARMTNAVSALAKLMKGGGPDLIISATLEANCVASLARKMASLTCPLMIFEQDVPGYEVGHSAVGNKFWSWMRRRAYRNVDRVIVPSYEIKRRLMNDVQIDAEKIIELYNPGRGYFSPPIKAPHAWLAEARSDPTFVAAGPLVKNSDFETLIKGIERTQKLLPCKVIILGDGPDKNKLFNFSKSRGLRTNVSFASDLENLHDYIYFSDGFISTALSSACPDVIIRAMEISSRIVCTNSPGGSREILGDGDYGKMLRMGDPDAIAYALYEVMQKPKMKAADRDVGRFDRGNFFDAVADEIDTLMTISLAAESSVIEGSSGRLSITAQ